MAFIRCDFSSASLMRSVNINVTIPQNVPLEKRKIMYLLGGLSDDNTMWSRRTNVERYAEECGVMECAVPFKSAAGKKEINNDTSEYARYLDLTKMINAKYVCGTKIE